MDLSDEQKVAVLVDRLNFHTGEIQRRQDKEVMMFEWSTGFLLAVFAVTIALSDRTSPLPYAVAVKTIATILVAVPTLVFMYRIHGDGPSQKRQAEVIMRIQEQLRLFDKDYYLPDDSLYPQHWRGTLAQGMMQRKTPRYYTAIMGLMVACVAIVIWLVL